MKSRLINRVLLVFVFITAAMPGTLFSAPSHAKVFGVGYPLEIGDLPPGRAKERLQALPAPARQQALNWLQRFSFPEQDLEFLRFDDQGGVYYADTHRVEQAPTEETGGAPAASGIALEDTFLLHSRSGASKVVYLDFDGHTITGTAWNSGSVDPLFALPYDTDGAAGFSETELRNIQEIWHRVAEDFAPFDIDVTTEEPAAFGPQVGRVLITHDTDAYGNDLPAPGGGGVAYVGVWGASNYQSYLPAFVYYNNLGNGHPPYVAEAASHEFGHNLSLSHDGREAPHNETYYLGHGSGYVSWAPIMGAGYYTNVTQWSKGEYAAANNNEDDLALISSRLGYRTDDHSDSMSSATPLMVEADGTLSVTSPETDNLHSPSPYNKGIIGSSTDTDLFTFDAGAGQLEIVVEPGWAAFYRDSLRGANLDISATLYDLSGGVIATSDPENETDAVISTTVPVGSYYLAITGVGNAVSPYTDYASLGQYFISGTVPPASVVTDPPAAPANLTATTVSHAQIDIGWADNADNESGFRLYRSLDGASWSLIAALGPNSTAFGDTGLNPETTYYYQVESYNDLGSASSNVASATTGSQPVPPATPTGISVTDGADGTAIVTWADNSNNETGFEVQREKQHKRRGWVDTTMVGATAADTTQWIDASGSDTFRYQVRAVNAVGVSAWSNWAEVTVTDGGDSGGGSGKCHPKKGC